MNPRQLMQQAHRSAKKEEEPVKLSKEVEKPSRPTTPATTPTPVIPDHVFDLQQPHEMHRSQDYPSTEVEMVARGDVPVGTYGVKPWKSNFNIYNKDLVEYVRNFSSRNQLAGGSAITKSQMLEVLLDVMVYDLGINPVGYDSPSELREHIKANMNLS